MNNHLSFEEGWKVLEQGIVKCSKILECTSTRPTVSEYMNYYDCSYRMAVQKEHYCLEMYNGFKTTLAECVRAMVLYLLSTLCVTGFFGYLDRCYVEQCKLPSLSDTAATSFFGQVFSYFGDEARTAILTLVQESMENETNRLAYYLNIAREDGIELCLQEI
nr:unnamed protein product [Digitaria exilis]